MRNVVSPDTASDGSIGVRVIKEHGGVVMIQSGDSAEYGDMPRNARIGDGGCVLSVKKMPPRLIEYAAHLEEVDDSQIGDGMLKNDRQAFKRIFALLSARTGHDFSQYE